MSVCSKEALMLVRNGRLHAVVSLAMPENGSHPITIMEKELYWQGS
jgi:hypothetical protein